MRQQRKAIPLEALDPELTNVSRKVIGAAIDVHKALGPGFDREVYINSLCMELDAESVGYKRDHTLPVTYKDTRVGELTLDLYVNDRFAVRFMAEKRPVDGLDRTRMRSQLRAAKLELGLIINFGEQRLKDGLVRVLNPDQLNIQLDDSDEHEYAESDAE